MNEHPTSDSAADTTAAAVRAELAATADTIEPGHQATALAAVRGTVRRRRRRRNSLVGVAGALALFASGMVVANLIDNSDNGDQLLVTAPATAAPADDDSSGDSDATTAQPDSPDDAVVTTGAPAVVEAATTAAAAEIIDPSDGWSPGVYQQLLPWKDGFLAISQIWEPQPLPAEFPQEILDQFPPEVLQLFEDAGGLPATIDEATQLLQEAGLYDEVSEIVLANPDVYDAVYSQPVPDPATLVRFSTDGDAWEDIDLELPSSIYGDRRITSTGDRLVVVTSVVNIDPAAEATPFRRTAPKITGITVHSTTDLQSWTSQSIDVATPTDFPDYVIYNAYINQIAANDDGWVVSLDSYTDIDYEQILPDDFDLEALYTSDYGYGMYNDDSGIVIETYSETGMAESRTLTWAELGLEGPPPGVSGFDASATSQMWAARWDGEAAQSDDADNYGQIVPVEGGFVRQGFDYSFSSDGLAWTSFDGPADGVDDWSTGLMSTPDGDVIALVAAQSGPGSAHRLDLTALTWERLDSPVIPEGFSPWSQTSNGATLYTIEDRDAYEPAIAEDFSLIVENETHTLDAFIAATGEQSYTLRDRATGEIVSSESVTDANTSDSPFEYLQELAGDGLELTSPETGEVITTFTRQDLENGLRSSTGGTDSATSVSDAPAVTIASGEVATTELGYEVVSTEDGGFAPYGPAMRVLATDGERWIDEPVTREAGSDGVDEADYGFHFPNDAVSNGEIVLVSFDDGSFLRFRF